MKFKITCGGHERQMELMKDSVLIGRPNNTTPPDVDLSPDFDVSRRHARVWLHAGNYWLEDLQSRTGTFVNGAAIAAPVRLSPGDSVLLGATTIVFDYVADGDPNAMRIDVENEAQLEPLAPAGGAPIIKAATAPQPKVPEPQIQLDESLPGDQPTMIPMTSKGERFADRLAVLLELPLHLSAEANLSMLLQTVVARVIEVIPGAERGALILNEPDSGRYRLKAHLPAGTPAISETLARRAINEGKAFIWHRSQEADPTESMRQLKIETGMYAPMIWQGTTLGVICVDNPNSAGLFNQDDLRFLLAVAHYAAAAVAGRQLQENLALKSRMLERLLTNYSPRVRQTLLDKARAGKLEPGGTRSAVTILFSDFRGFTSTSSKMDAVEVMEMLNEYFPPLVDTIFRCDGTVDKFIGDAILAVFGSPEPDAEQCVKAVRAAVAMRETVARVNEKRVAQGKPACEIGIGVHCGEVVHGFIGAAERLEYTVIGDAVNRASRYCNGAKGGEVLVSEAIFEQVYAHVHAEKTSIPTKHEGDFVAYRVTGMKK